MSTRAEVAMEALRDPSEELVLYAMGHVYKKLSLAAGSNIESIVRESIRAAFSYIDTPEVA